MTAPQPEDVTGTLNRHLPPCGQCGICGIPGLDQRHRIIDAVEDHAKAGEEADDIAEEMGLSLSAVHAILGWCRQNPDQGKRGPWLEATP